MAFHEQSFEARYARMGDEAELKFREVNPSHARFGLNRPNINLSKVPEFIRYMPDYLMHDRLVECMGVGQDQVLKLKIDKLQVLLDWDVGMPVTLFIWDSYNGRCTEVIIQEVAEVARLSPVEEFHDGKAYYAIPLDALIARWRT